MISTRGAYRRRQSRRSTITGVAGVVLIAAGFLLTLAHVGGNVLPTILGFLGVALLIAGITIGSMVVVENFRYKQDQSFYDDE